MVRTRRPGAYAHTRVYYREDGSRRDRNRRGRRDDRRKPAMKLDSLPFPEWELFPMTRYTECLKFAGMGPSDMSFPMITTRGFINRCSFCYRMETGVRARGLKSILGG